MAAGAFALILLAGLIHAGWNFVAKKAGGDARFAFFTAACNMLVWSPLGWWLGRKAVPLWGAAEWAVVAASGLLHVLYYIVLLRGYRVGDLTVVYPLARGSAPLLSSLTAVLLPGEHLSGLGAAGIAGVVGGVFLIAGGPALWQAARHSQDAAARQRVRRGVGHGLLTGAFIAGYTVVDGYAVKVLGMSPVLVDYMGNLLRLGLLLPVVLRDLPAARGLWRLQWKPALAVGAVSPIAYVLVLYAMQQAPLSHVAPAREVSMLFAALLGGRLLGERDRGLRIAGALCIAAGVAALAR
ncbi:EamA family transporter [Xylophilus sp.]|uniref:EamA family transporter n=1 Tax=Xylophilus sp. TaxID=2653893 RepID=UPI0013BB4638|nr:EamA family transporter [Xylophilus sp.]KAF1047952.1 MAG: hypothetical protein GAK38_01663 [Xylophilus sp.]